MRRKIIILLLIIVLLVAVTSCKKFVRGPGTVRPYENVLLNTTDGVLIAASYYPSDSYDGLILLHMSGKTRHSYDDIAQELMDKYQIISLDFRGYGDSPGDFTEMPDSDYDLLLLDIAAADKALRERGAKKISIVGSSLGANAALLYAVNHPVDKLVLLAPGSKLRGLDISRTTYSGPMLIQVGRNDAYASISADELQGNWEKGKIMLYESGAHGTDLLLYDLSAHEDFMFYMS